MAEEWAVPRIPSIRAEDGAYAADPRQQPAFERKMQRALAGSRRDKDQILAAAGSAVRKDAEDSTYPNLAKRLAKRGFKNDRKRVFFRFGELPKDGRSCAGPVGADRELHYEAGTSVFAGKRTRDGHYIIRITDPDLRLMIIASVDLDRGGYLCRGRVVGRGTSSEPLLKVSHMEPVPDGCLVAIPGGSYALDTWNERRFGGRLDEVPELARYFEEPEGR